MVGLLIKRIALVSSSLAIAVSGVAAGLGVAASTVQAEAVCTISDKLVNSCRPWLGAAAGGYPNVSGVGGQALAHEERIGRQLDIVHLYTDPGSHVLSDDSVFFASRPDTILSVTWQPASRWADADNTNAVTNANIDSMADSILALGNTKIMLTLHHEPENDVSGGGIGCSANKAYVGNAGTPQQYRTMWQTVRDRFDAKGVTNVVWVMNYMGYSGWDCIVDDLWPGNHLVDWLMYDPYGEKVDFPTLIGRFYRFLEQNSDAEHDYLSKPWGLAEFGSWHNATQEHAYLLYQTAKQAVEANTFWRLKAYSVFDFGKTCRIAYDRNGNYDPQELELYRQYAQSSAFVDPTEPPTPDTEPPSAVTGLNATAAEASVSLRWNAASDNVAVTDYDVYRNNTLLVSTSDVNVVDATVVTGQSYTYFVRAKDIAGNVGPASSEVTVSIPETPGPDTTPPSTPTGFSGLAGTRSATLSWNAATDNVGVAGYYLVRDGVRIATLGADTLTYTDTGLTSGRSYWYKVRAFDATGNRGEQATVVVNPL